jgi:hypothetical protein
MNLKLTKNHYILIVLISVILIVVITISAIILNSKMRQGCGQRPHLSNINQINNNIQRIINGKDAIESSWPWMVSIRYFFPRDNYTTEHKCGGVLISDRHVLTAANCIHDKLHHRNNHLLLII